MRLEKKIVGVIGAYSHPNFGDQLLFNILHSWIKESCPDVVIIVPWGDANGIQWPDGVLVGGGIKELLRCNAVIFGGGGYFGEPGNNADREPKDFTRLDKVGAAMHLPKNFGGVYFGKKGYLRAETLRFIKYGGAASLMSLKGIPYCIIGTGLGPVTTWLGRWGVGATLKNAEFVSLRDCESVKYAKDISPGTQIEEFVDIVLSLTVSIDQKFNNPINRVALHVGPRIERHLSVEILVEMIKEIRALNVDVSLVTDCAPPDEHDVNVFGKLSAKLGSEIEYIPYNGVESFIRTLDDFDVILTTKLHSGILGYSKGLFPISVAEHVKTKRFYKQIGLEDYCFELSKNGFMEAIKCLESIKQTPDMVAQILSIRRDRVKSLAHQNKSMLEEFIKSHFHYIN